MRVLPVVDGSLSSPVTQSMSEGLLERPPSLTLRVTGLRDKMLLSTQICKSRLVLQPMYDYDQSPLMGFWRVSNHADDARKSATVL